jgi:hypothetical protein
MQELMSYEDFSISATRMVSQNHNSEGTEGKWKDISPTTAKALQTRAVKTGELAEVPGYRIAKLEYAKPYVIGNKDIYSDTIVYSESKGLEVVLTKRLQQLGLVTKQVAQIGVEETVEA